MPVNDPVMAVLDKLPLASPPITTPDSADATQSEFAPFGLRFAVGLVMPDDKHQKTYYTVTVQEATQVSEDGNVVTRQDSVQRERED